jgi:Raf kinase inhibitor-like YbhB/YbcL family protein
MKGDHMSLRNPMQWARAMLAVGAAAVALAPVLADESSHDQGSHAIEVTSATFTPGSTLPLSAIDTILSDGVNTCTPNGAPGLDKSPELSWTHVPHDTRSFVVILYDPTAAFTHWGMYNIAPDVRTLPQNAGVADSAYGTQITNDFGDPHYDGPCPPAGVEPFAHRYVFTVYALDERLTLESSANFPADAETLYHALIQAGRAGHILASGSIEGIYSATPSS